MVCCLIFYRAAIEDRLARTEHDLDIVKSEFNRQKTIDGAKIGELESIVQDLSKELQGLRERHVRPLISFS
jgi:hypothetical protein